jgi:hypothetical protein
LNPAYNFITVGWGAHALIAGCENRFIYMVEGDTKVDGFSGLIKVDLQDNSCSKRGELFRGKDCTVPCYGHGGAGEAVFVPSGE